LVDSNFTQTVVLVTQAPDGSTVGVVLNRPTGQRDEKTSEPIFRGGPVMPNVRFELFRCDGAPAACAFHGPDEVQLSMAPAHVEAVPMHPGRRLRFFTGYSGWAPGQLQRELQLDAWYVLPVTEELLFRANTRGLWKELSEKARGSRADGKNGDRLVS